MTLVFAWGWNAVFEHGKRLGDVIQVDNRNFGYIEARAAIRMALGKPGGDSLRSWIDNDMVRVINGPHRSDSDKRLHMTLHCKNARNGEATCHVYIADNGNGQECSFEPTFNKRGNLNNAYDTPTINTSADL